MFLNYQKSTGNDISETVKTNTFRTLVEMRSLNRNVRPPFQETPDQPLLSPEDIMIMTSSVPQNNILPRAPQNLSAALLMHTKTFGSGVVQPALPVQHASGVALISLKPALKYSLPPALAINVNSALLTEIPV